MPPQPTAPVQGQALQQKPELRIPAIAGWLEGLRALPAVDAAPQVLAELIKLNRWELAGDARQELTLSYQPTIRKLIKDLIATLPENGTPQTPNHRQAAILAQSLSQELAAAWKLVLRDKAQPRFAFSADKQRQNVLAQLLTAQSALICTSLCTYTQPPIYAWQELHRVFASLHRPNETDGSEQQGVLLDTVYKRALLLALADPFRFTRSEMEATLAYINHFASLAALTTSDQHERSVFLINSERDMPGAQTLESGVEQALMLNTQGLGKHLASLTRKLKAGGSPEKLGLPPAFNQVDAILLMQRLRKGWCGGRQRSFQRYRTVEQMQVEAVCGVDEIHKLLGEVAGNPDSLFAASAKWRVVNDSASGISISAQARDVPQIRLGDPIVMRLQEASDWMLGVVRWGRIGDGVSIEAGVEKLAPVAVPAMIRLLAVGSLQQAANTAEKALLIPPNETLRISERLLLPRGLYARDREAELWHEGQRHKIMLLNLVEQSPVFDLVEFVHY